MKKYSTIQEVKEAVLSGAVVNWCNSLYYVKIDFEGDFVIKCIDSSGQELLDGKHEANDFFTIIKKN